MIRYSFLTVCLFYLKCGIDLSNTFVFNVVSGMCAWNNHECWPGTCTMDLAKSCNCSLGFQLISTPSETSCQCKYVIDSIRIEMFSSEFVNFERQS